MKLSGKAVPILIVILLALTITTSWFLVHRGLPVKDFILSLTGPFAYLVLIMINKFTGNPAGDYTHSGEGFLALAIFHLTYLLSWPTEASIPLILLLFLFLGPVIKQSMDKALLPFIAVLVTSSSIILVALMIFMKPAVDLTGIMKIASGSLAMDNQGQSMVMPALAVISTLIMILTIFHRRILIISMGNWYQDHSHIDIRMKYLFTFFTQLTKVTAVLYNGFASGIASYVPGKDALRIVLIAIAVMLHNRLIILGKQFGMGMETLLVSFVCSLAVRWLFLKKQSGLYD